MGKPLGSPGFGGEEGKEGERRGSNIQVASFRRHISMNCLISDTSFGMMGEFEFEFEWGGEEKSQVFVLLGKLVNFRFNYFVVGCGLSKLEKPLTKR